MGKKQTFIFIKRQKSLHREINVNLMIFARMVNMSRLKCFQLNTRSENKMLVYECKSYSEKYAARYLSESVLI